MCIRDRYMGECIQAAVPMINDKLRAQSCNYLLRAQPSLYEVYYAKKNGTKKPDYPPFYNEQILSQARVSYVVMCAKNEDAIIWTDRNPPKPNRYRGWSESKFRKPKF
eukprot:TRINITY_DN9883_c0_g1_i2.p1 TRINITY_DN9883_c0_g1~~TRINITY_DN9883_c0_g1_i2.p1  ORF type:complete len:108 (-),score=14.02 TRINITY_DN9883_c0_g1_i2:247-570(-)